MYPPYRRSLNLIFPSAPIRVRAGHPNGGNSNTGATLSFTSTVTFQKARPESLDRDVTFVRAGKVASEDRVRAGGKNKLKIKLSMPSTIPSKQ